MEDTKEMFKNAIDKAYTTQPNVTMNKATIEDNVKYKQGFTENDDEEDDFDLKQKHISKRAARDKFKEDLQNDPDFNDFKEKSKYNYNRAEYSFGSPHAINNDPFVNKRKHKIETKEATGSGSSGGFSGPIAFKDSDFVRRSFKETPKLKEETTEKVEATEATGSGSVGGYSSPSMWAKSTKKKDWGPSRKTQIPGGNFVSVKKKCSKFPYCNKGDINALNISKNESVKEAIKNVAKKLNISESTIMTILEYEYEKISKTIN
jgi:hypothetical protein